MSESDVVEIIGYLMTSFSIGFAGGFLMRSFFRAIALSK